MEQKLLIIQPSYYRSKTDRTAFKVRRRNVVPLTLPYLAALTPPTGKSRLSTNNWTDRFRLPALDLVAISTWTLNSFRAYDIADEFRRRGVPVIMGGPHTFFHADEAGEHCDAVGIGEAEAIWPEMLEDALHGRLHKTLPGRTAAGAWPACRCRATICWTCAATVRSGPLPSSPRAAARSAASFAPNGSCSASVIVAGRCRKSSRRSSIAARATFSSATAILAASGATRWN